MTTTDTLFTITTTPPPPLIIARIALARAQDALLEAEQLHDDQGPEAMPVLEAARADHARIAAEVARLEAAEIAQATQKQEDGK